MYQITKQDNKDKGRIILMVDAHSEILEFDTLHEAEDFCKILNANSSGFKYSVKRVGSKPRHKETEASIHELNAINFYLDEAFEYGLATEVVTFALKHMKDGSKLKPVEAMALGFNDWVK